MGVASTDAKRAGDAGSSADNRRGEADLAVAPGPPDADVVVLVGQVDVVWCRVGRQTCRGARVPVKTGNAPYNININNISTKRTKV